MAKRIGSKRKCIRVYCDEVQDTYSNCRLCSTHSRACFCPVHMKKRKREQKQFNTALKLAEAQSSSSLLTGHAPYPARLSNGTGGSVSADINNTLIPRVTIKLELELELIKCIESLKISRPKLFGCASCTSAQRQCAKMPGRRPSSARASGATRASSPQTPAAAARGPIERSGPRATSWRVAS
jgi:hypothetical protein